MFANPVSATLYAFPVPFTVVLVPAVRFPVKVIEAPAVVSEINTVVAFTVEPKVTPEVLSVIVNAPAVPDPSAPIVARPPASRIVKPPDKSAIVPMLIVAPAVEPESNVKLSLVAVTFPTIIVPAAALPVSKVTAEPNTTVPKLIAVSTVVIVPFKVLEELAVANNPPVNVVVNPAPPIVTAPVFRKLVAPAIVPPPVTSTL